MAYGDTVSTQLEGGTTIANLVYLPSFPLQWPFQELKLEMPTLYGLCRGYVRGYTPEIWLYMVQYLQLRYLKWPLNSCIWEIYGDISNKLYRSRFFFRPTYYWRVPPCRNPSSKRVFFCLIHGIAEWIWFQVTGWCPPVM